MRVNRSWPYILLLALASCAPSYVWGDAQGVKQRLLNMVPTGSSPALLADTAAERGWTIDQRNIRSWSAGSATYMNDPHANLDCHSHGGLVVPVMIAHYQAPFDTDVESLWLFDTQQRLRDVCVRKTVDAP